MSDTEILHIGVTAICTFSGTLLTMGRWFHGSVTRLNARIDGSVTRLNERIDSLSNSIISLDKNLAVQTAIFEKFIISRGQE